MSTAKSRSKEWRERFLEEFRRTGNVTRSAKAAGVDRTTVWNHREDPEFERLYNEALDDAVDLLEAEAWRRATEGTERVKLVRAGKDDKGNPVFRELIERTYSDVLLIFLLKGLRPERYRESYDLKGLIDRLSHQAQPASGGKSGDPPMGE